MFHARHSRPNRSSADRRAQYARADVRIVQRLMHNFSTLQHRGCQPTVLGTALHKALSSHAEHDTSVGLSTHSRNADTSTLVSASSPDLFLPLVTAVESTQQQLGQLSSVVQQISDTMTQLFDAQYQLVLAVRSLPGAPNCIPEANPTDGAVDAAATLASMQTAMDIYILLMALWIPQLHFLPLCISLR